MNRYAVLLSNTILISAATFGSKILVFFMVRFYTAYLNPADYGTADLITQTANLLLPVVTLGITDAVFRFVMEKPAEAGKVFTAGIFVILAGAVPAIIAVQVLRKVPGLSDFAPLIVGYVLAAAIHSLCTQYTRAVGDTKLYALQGILGTVLVILCNLVFLAGLGIGIRGYVLSIVLSDLACTAVLVRREHLGKKLERRMDRRLLRRMLRYSIPMIPTGIFWWITSVSDRYMVTMFLGRAENGIYTVACKIPTILVLLAGVFLEAWQYSAVREMPVKAAGGQSGGLGPADYAKFYSRIWRIFQAWMVLICSLVIAMSRIEIRALAEESYFSAWKYLPVLCLAMLFSAFVSFLGSVYLVKIESAAMFWTSMLAAGINLVLNWLLIPSPLGLQGAAIATAVSYAAVFVVRVFSVRRRLAFRISPVWTMGNLLVLLLQTLCMVLQCRGWVWIQLACLLFLAGWNGKTLLWSARGAARMVMRKAAGMIQRKKGVRE